MKRINLVQIIIAILFILALALGLVRREDNLFGSKKTIPSFAATSNNSLESFYLRGQELTKTTKPTKTSVTFLSVGDIMLSRNVALKIQTSKNNAWPFLGLTELFESVDFSFGNLETPVAKDKGIIGGHSLVFNSPKAYVEELVNVGFKIVNLANNHAMDQGQKGLDHTLEFLNSINLKYVGVGKDLSQAWQPAIVEQNGIKICFIGASYASINDNGKTYNDFVARIEDMENLKSSIASSKSKCDFTVVTMHAGTEYKRNPNQAQITFARSTIDFGADIIIGAHPHWIQTVEKYNGKYIFYSLGNFIFDQNFSQDTKEGLTLKITISKNAAQATGLLNSTAAQGSDLQGQRTPASLEQIELIPVIIENSQPRPANPEEAKKILEKIGEKETILK
jgi:poly-gamma-glutamate synthesis protein (capsule biosynthesis protein)